jgi:hypothetical protein
LCGNPEKDIKKHIKEIRNKNEHRSIGAKIIGYLYLKIEHEKSRRTYIKMKKFCKEYLALQKNILFAPGN